MAALQARRSVRRAVTGPRGAGRILGVVCVTLVLAWLAAVALAASVAAYKLFLLIAQGPGQVIGGP